jgi:hypothetical protein
LYAKKSEIDVARVWGLVFYLVYLARFQEGAWS